MATEQLPTAAEEGPLRPVPALEGGRIRGILLHKLIEELITGELEESQSAAASRAALLRDQLLSTSQPDVSLDTAEIATTALKTFQLPEIKPFRRSLVAEVPIHAVASGSYDHLVSGRADAVAQDEDGGVVVFDWKSDIAPKEADRATYRQQLGHYLEAIGSRRGAIVYMTSGRVDWVRLSPR